MTKQQASNQAVYVNRIIHRYNLYSGHSRYIHARGERVSPKGDSPKVYAVTVENLQTGQRIPFVNDGSFRDGYGSPVTQL